MNPGNRGWIIVIQNVTTSDSHLIVLDQDQASGDSLGCLLRAHRHQCVILNHIDQLNAYKIPENKSPLLLVDVGPNLERDHLLHRFVEEHSDLPFIAMSCSSGVNLAVAYTRMGAVSFLQKPIPLDMLIQAVKSAMQISMNIQHYKQQRKVFEQRLLKLSQREQEVMYMVVDGLSSSQIARELNISIKTVSLHRTNLMNKLEANGVVQLVRTVIPTPMSMPLNHWQSS